MDDLLNHIIYQIGSGNAFFAGAAMILVAVVASPFAGPRWVARNLLVLIGGVAITISAVPLPWWGYVLLGTATSLWFAGEMVRPAWLLAWLALCRVGVALVWLGAVGAEVPYHVMPTLPPLGKPTLFIIGDSVSAGMREGDRGTWPNRLAARDHVDVRDFSRMGATVKSARKQAEKIGDETGLVLLEIGGNDVLGSTRADEFEEQLELLLIDVCQRDRTVVMLELPLPPFANRFGIAQRRLARKYDVTLVPRRFFVTILTSAGATVDGIHLSPGGHEMMADAIGELIRPAYAVGE